MGIYGELLGLSGLLMRGHGTPTPRHMWPYLDSLVVLSLLLKIRVIQFEELYCFKSFHCRDCVKEGDCRSSRPL